jgi:hypothetical protein
MLEGNYTKSMFGRILCYLMMLLEAKILGLFSEEAAVARSA